MLGGIMEFSFRFSFVSFFIVFLLYFHNRFACVGFGLWDDAFAFLLLAVGFVIRKGGEWKWAEMTMRQRIYGI